MKVLWLHPRISASIIINAFLIISVDGFNHITNYHENMVWHESVNLFKTATGHDITLSKPILEQKYTHVQKKKKIEERLGVYRTRYHRKEKSTNSTKPC